MRRWLWSWWALRQYRPLTPEAREGDRVHVTGIVRAADQSIVAPLSGRTCVAYHARAATFGGSKNPRDAGRAASGESLDVTPFFVDDVLVVGEHARLGVRAVKIPDDHVRLSRFLALHNIVQGMARFAEVVVEPGMRVTAAGTLVLVPREEPPQDERGFREAPSLEPRIVGNRDAPLVIVAA